MWHEILGLRSGEENTHSERLLYFQHPVDFQRLRLKEGNKLNSDLFSETALELLAREQCLITAPCWERMSQNHNSSELVLSVASCLSTLRGKCLMLDVSLRGHGKLILQKQRGEQNKVWGKGAIFTKYHFPKLWHFASVSPQFNLASVFVLNL